MPEEEIRIFTIPLRSDVPRSRKTSNAIKLLRNKVARYTKSDNIWIDPVLNQTIWKMGIKKHPPKIRVKATKFEDGLVEVTLLGEEKKEISTTLEEEKEKNA